MKIFQCILERNPCYQKYSGQKLPRKGIVVHSTGANNTTLKRYVQPHEGQTAGMSAGYYEMLRLLGTNVNQNDWNRVVKPAVCVHAFVGKLADGTVASVQTLPWEQKCWGSGSGWRGSYNGSHIQFEICEDRTDPEYTAKAYKEAVALCAHLCRSFGLTDDSIVSHKEAYSLGYATGHEDPEHWLEPMGFTMDGLRRDVARLLRGETEPDYRTILQERAGLEEKTMDYLSGYQYGADLIRKLATMK